MKHKVKLKKKYTTADVIKIMKSNHKEHVSILLKCMAIMNDTLAELASCIMIFNKKVSKKGK